MLRAIKRLFCSDSNQRRLSRYWSMAGQINAIESIIANLTQEEMIAKTEFFKNKFSSGLRYSDADVVETFAMVREASKRTLGMRHFDVQLLGGMSLLDCCIAEMKTGEGKTLVSTLPVYLKALNGKGVHVVTVNDYLVKRDSEWMEKIFTYLGLSVACITDTSSWDEKVKAYASDVTYITNSELGFDYLRDNMKYSRQEMCLLNKHELRDKYAVIDEVDSILIDEARTPLIISGPSETNVEYYQKIDRVVKNLESHHYELDEKTKTAILTDVGSQDIEEALRKNGVLGKNDELYGLDSYSVLNIINQSLKARNLLHKDIDYIVKEGEILLVDEFTGRVMDGRRYSDGLHQAIEAKENVKIKSENQTLASITYQNLFRMYGELAGMTGTAKTEAKEFADIYALPVVSIPTNKIVNRKDMDDLIYMNDDDKYDSIVQLTKECYNKGQPILLGTVSIEKSEKLSSVFKKHGITHNVLNAKYHEKEAHIIANAGRKGVVTIATNMAGRGTDIMLGGNLDVKIADATKSFDKDSDKYKEIVDKITQEHQIEKQDVIDTGGLLVVGTERHESRRIDNQLRGRSGRQGDIGKTQFFLSLNDDLLRIFGGEKIGKILSKLGYKGKEAINHPLLTRVIEKSQKKVESFHYDMRKNLLRYDDILNEQRKMIYNQRLEYMDSDDMIDILCEIIIECNESMISSFSKKGGFVDMGDIDSIIIELHEIYGEDFDIKEFIRRDTLSSSIISHINEKSLNKVKSKIKDVKKDIVNDLIRKILLTSIDECWRNHMQFVSHMREGIHLRSYAQKDPLSEFKIEAYKSFENVIHNFNKNAIAIMTRVEIER